jgi:ABC-type uncharacterized transport system substrate-binding protein
VDRRTFLGALAGGLLAAPLAAKAEQSGKVWRVGSLHATPPAPSAPLIASFEKGLAARGQIKDRTITIEYVFKPGPREQLQEAARALSERVDFLVAWGTIVAVAAKEARVSCPVVFSPVGFPVALGMVSNLRRPGGNFTGISFEGADETYGKRLQILKEIVPRATRVAALGRVGRGVTERQEVPPELHLVSR